MNIPAVIVGPSNYDHHDPNLDRTFFRMTAESEHYPISWLPYGPEYEGAPLSYIAVTCAESAEYGPTDPRTLDSYGEPTIVAATSDEAMAFSGARELFEASMKDIETLAEEATKAYERSMADLHAAHRRIWETYLPVQEELGRRAQAVETTFEDHQKKLNDEREEDARLAQAKEDARLGPRVYGVRRPRDTDQTGVGMDVPTVHLVTCSTLKNNKVDGWKRVKWEPLRAGETLVILMAGGVAQQKIDYSWRPVPDSKVLPGKVCGRCKPEPDLMSHDPKAYLAWRDQAENLQPGAPSERRLETLFAKAGINFNRFTNKPNVWTTAGKLLNKEYRQGGHTQPYETLIGWIYQSEKDDNKVYLADGVEKRAAALVGPLAAVGLTIRVVTRPIGGWDLGQEATSEHYLGVRYLTAAEKRQRGTTTT